MTVVPSPPSGTGSESGSGNGISFSGTLFEPFANRTVGFPIRGSDVKTLTSPSSFHETLKDQIRHSEREITLSSLYFGTGPLENEIIECLERAIENHPSIRVKILLDHSRGSRGFPARESSISMFKPLLQKYPSNIQMFLYKVPQLKGLKACLPSPFNEGIGVSHMKAYVFDDNLVMSGANLSEDYFTNRQDRYVILQKCGQLAAFYHTLVNIIAQHSFPVIVSTEGNVQFSNENETVQNVHALKGQLLNLVQRDEHDSPEGEDCAGNIDPTTDTWAIPTIQFTPIDVRHDEFILQQFLNCSKSSHTSSMQIASGYLNFPEFLTRLVESSKATHNIDVYAASMQANGFYNASGIKGAVPMAYSLLEKKIYDRLCCASSSTKVSIFEYNRPEWTYHAKGMWISSKDPKKLPNYTVFGSSNFGRRSYERDLESQVFLYTKNAQLRESLQTEVHALGEFSVRVDENTWKEKEKKLEGLFRWRSGFWIRPVTRLISSFL